MNKPKRTNVSQVILSSVLKDEKRVDVTLFEPDDFPNKYEKLIWSKVLLASKKENLNTSYHLVVRNLLPEKEMPHEGWDIYIDELISIETSEKKDFSFYYDVFVREVKATRAYTQLVKALNDLAVGDKSPEECWPTMKAIIINKDENVITGAKVHDFWRETVHDRANNASKKYISTGYEYLDDLLVYKINPGQISIIAARPKMGKTTFRANLCNNLLKQKIPQLIWSREMGIQREYDLLLSIGTGIPSRYIQQPRLGLKYIEDYKRKIEEYNTKFEESNIAIFDSVMPTVKSITTFLDVYREEHPLQVAWLDNFDNIGEIYLQSGSAAQSYNIRSGLRMLQDYCVQYSEHIHINSTWQISRAVEDNSRRNDRRPTLADMGFSDAVAQVTDWIVVVYRKSYYATEETVDNGETEIILRARRGGGAGLGTIYLYKDQGMDILHTNPD